MIHAFEAARSGDGSERYLLLDVESGAVHELDAAAFAIAKAIENGEDPASIAIDNEDTSEILSELGELSRAGLFDSPIRPDAPYEDGVIKAMCLHLAHDCNLRCKYCFASTGEFQGERKLMSYEVGKAALDFLIEHSGKRRNLEVDFFGGEPLMNFSVLSKLVAYGRKLERAHDKVIRFTVTTNGLALNEEMSEFLNREMHNVVISLDGRREVHDDMRPVADGSGSYERILPKLKAFVESRGDKEYYARGTFTNKNLDFMEDVLSIRDAGFEQISLEPVVLEKSHDLAIREEHVEKVLKEYDRLYEYMRDNKGEWFNFFHFMLDMEDGPCLRKRISGCGAGVSYVAVAPEGDIYPCHQFVGEDCYKLGNVNGSFDPMKSFLACNVRTKPDCVECWAKYFCGGGCHANAFKLKGDIYKTDDITCTLLKKRTECAIALNV